MIRSTSTREMSIESFLNWLSYKILLINFFEYSIIWSALIFGTQESLKTVTIS